MTRQWAAAAFILTLVGCGRSKPATGGTPDASDGAVEPAPMDAAPEAPAALDVPAADAEVGPLDAAGAADRPRAGVMAIAVGKQHDCALLDDHRVKCWGSNTYGQLGYGDTVARGEEPAQMGDALPAVDLGTGRTATALAAGRYYTCALLDDGSIKCWGLGTSAFVGRPPAAGPGSLGDEPGEMGDHLPAIDLGPGRKAVKLAAGQFTACALLDDGTARCWGSTAPSPTPSAVPLGSDAKVRALVSGFVGVLALFDDGDLRGELPVTAARSQLLEPGQTAVGGAGGDGNLCAVLSNGRAICGSYASQPLALPPGIVGLGVSRLSGKCGLLADGTVHCTEALGAGYGCPRDADDTDADGFKLPLDRPAVALGSGGDLQLCAILMGGAVRCWTSAGGADSPPVTPELMPSFDRTATGCARWRDVDLGTRP